MNKGHVHAELMAQYAEDARETDRPWERWQVGLIHPGSGYITCECHPSWQPDHAYRRKPTQVQVAGEVFDDVVLDSEPFPDPVWVVRRGTVKALTWGAIHPSVYKEGRVHTTYEGALRHLEALKPKVL